MNSVVHGQAEDAALLDIEVDAGQGDSLAVDLAQATGGL